jgi:A nuclease family of the HNH/ENDO VII superfamily with conserved AHH
MGKDTRPGTTEEIFASPVPNAPLLRAAVTRSRASSSLNPVAFGNQAILAKNKRAILYKNGYTLPGKATALLAAEAASGIKHSQKLGRNLRNANPSSVSALETDAHHVVASQASAADASRDLIFSVGIGINDADNGVVLPRFKTTKIASMPNASPHQHIHTAEYHATVVVELGTLQTTQPTLRKFGASCDRSPGDWY